MPRYGGEMLSDWFDWQNFVRSAVMVCQVKTEGASETHGRNSQAGVYS